MYATHDSAMLVKCERCKEQVEYYNAIERFSEYYCFTCYDEIFAKVDLSPQ